MCVCVSAYSFLSVGVGMWCVRVCVVCICEFFGVFVYEFVYVVFESLCVCVFECVGVWYMCVCAVCM